MLDRRFEPRTLCNDTVQLEWSKKSGDPRRMDARLDHISRSGAQLLLDQPVPLGTSVRMIHDKGELRGKVRHCVSGPTGFDIGVEFNPGSEWSEKDYRPRQDLKLRRARRT